MVNSNRTVRECLLPSKAVILYRPAIIPWTTFADAATNYDRHAYFCRYCKDGAGLPNSAQKCSHAFLSFQPPEILSLVPLQRH